MKIWQYGIIIIIIIGYRYSLNDIQKVDFPISKNGYKYISYSPII